MSSSGGGGGAPKSPFGFHESARELDQIRRRREIRMKLQAEFNRVFYNPHRHSQHIEIVSAPVLPVCLFFHTALVDSPLFFALFSA